MRVRDEKKLLWNRYENFLFVQQEAVLLMDTSFEDCIADVVATKN